MGSDFLIAHQAERDINYVKTMKTFLQCVKQNDYLNTTELNMNIKYPEGYEYIYFVKDGEYKLSNDTIEHLEELCEHYHTNKIEGSLNDARGIETYLYIDQLIEKGMELNPNPYPFFFLFYTTPLY